MIYSFVFLGERNRKEVLKQIASNLTLPFSSYQVLFLTNKEPKNEKLFEEYSKINFKTIVFNETATEEEMVEALVHSNQTLGSVVLIKSSAVNINFRDLNAFINKNQNGAKLVVSKQVKNETFLSKIFNPIKKFFARLFLGLKLFPGEANIVLLDNVLVSTLSEINGKSALLTKVNGWAGVEAKTAPIQEQPKQTKKFNFSTLKFATIWALLLLAMIVGNVLFAVLSVKISFLAYFAYALVEFALLILTLYSTAKSLFKANFGKIDYTAQASVIKIIDNYEE